MRIAYLPLLFAALALSACDTSTEAGSPPAHFGNAVAQNIAVQLVNPDAIERDDPLTYSGQRSVLAQKRYVTDKTEKATVTSTTTSATSGGGAK